MDNVIAVVCVSEGAAWIWAIVFMCFAARIEILDWGHVAQRLWTIANTHVVTERNPTHWVSTQKTALVHSRLRQVMHAMRLLYPKGSQLPEPVRHANGYILHNRHRMDYADFRHAG